MNEATPLSANGVLNEGLAAVPKHPVLLQMGEIYKQQETARLKEEAERQKTAEVPVFSQILALFLVGVCVCVCVFYGGGGGLSTPWKDKE